ncbi:cytochrome P450 [Mycena amicta]|nr:cytochrome P450 [Mycena amicta]
MFAPGAAFLAKNGLLVGIPAVCSAALIRQLAIVLFGKSIPTWVLVSAAAASFPIYIALRVLIRDFRHGRAAAAMGARLAPTSNQGKLPGNIDMLYAMMKIWEHGYPGDGLRETLEETGPVVDLRVMFDNIIMTTEPMHIKLILATDFSNYVKGEKFQFGMRSVLGTGVFNSDGEMWKFHRTLTRPYFSRDRISHFEIFDRHADQVITLLKQRMKTGYAVDFQDLIGRFTMDSATEFLFGSCVHSLHASLPLPHNASQVASESGSADPVHARVAMEFLRAFNETLWHTANRARIGWTWPLVEMWSDRTAKPMKIVSAYIDPIIEERLQKKKVADALKNNSEKKDVEDATEAMTLLDDLVGMTSDPQVLKDETLNILLAGKDTTQWTTTVAVYFLAMYPQVTARLREEILKHIGPTRRRPTYDDIRAMKFLRAVINETMRLYPAVPFNVRESVHATIWPSPDPTKKPIYIPAATQVPYSVFLMHRRKDLWGPDAEEFDPDRFLDGRLQKYLLKDAFKFLPFNAGPRVCLGQQFAYNEISFIIIRLLQNFSEVSLDTEAFRPDARPDPDWAALEGRKAMDKFRPKMHLTMYSEGGMWLKMKEATEGA